MTKGIMVVAGLLLSVGVYFGISAYMLNEYQLSIEASRFIGLITAGIFCCIALVAVILVKSIPKLYETHGVSEEDDIDPKDKN